MTVLAKNEIPILCHNTNKRAGSSSCGPFNYLAAVMLQNTSPKPLKEERLTFQPNEVDRGGEVVEVGA